jgi:hypothetical protein
MFAYFSKNNNNNNNNLQQMHKNTYLHMIRASPIEKEQRRMVKFIKLTLLKNFY